MCIVYKGMHACVLASTAFAADVHLLKSYNIECFTRVLVQQFCNDIV